MGPLSLIELTPEGRIIAALFEGPKTYGQLRSSTRLSDRWLSEKLKQLSASGTVGEESGAYSLRASRNILKNDHLFARYVQTSASKEAKSRAIAGAVSNNQGVVGVVLFGSLVKGEATEESDIDLLVVTEDELEGDLTDLIYSLMFEYDIPVDAVLMTYDELIAHLQAKTSFSFGLLEGYSVQYDTGGIEGLLSIKEREMRKNWSYDDEAGAWTRKSERTSKLGKTS